MPITIGIVVLVLLMSIIKDMVEFSRGTGSIGGVALKSLFILIAVGSAFILKMMLNDIQNDTPDMLAVGSPIETVAEATEESSVVDKPKPIIEEVAEEPAPIVEETTQPTTEVVQAAPAVSTPDPNWMPKDNLEDSWNYAVTHKWTIMYKGKEMDPKYISYKYYNITFDKDKYIVTLTDK